MSSSVTQSVTNDDVYLGFWINYSFGPIRGATLTVTRRNGGLLTAFLALYVTVAGTEFWRISCFIMHHLLSSEKSVDGIHHQRQAILRNAANGASALWSLLRMNWVWRKHTQAQPIRRILPLTTYTLIILVTFALAGLFSSQVSTSMGNEVLLLGRNCGILNPNSDIDAESYCGTVIPYWTQRLISNMNYAQECYHNTTYIQDFPTFVRKNLPWTSQHDIGCPFPGQDKICRSNSTNLRLDSGYINSNSDLGINAPPEDQFFYRSVVECAPLSTEGYSENVTEYSRNSNTIRRQVMRYYYGNRPHTNPTTYEYPADPPLQITYKNMSSTTVNADYTVRSELVTPSLHGSVDEERGTRHFIPDLQVPMADVTLLFLSAIDIISTEPSDDSWYSAHVPFVVKNNGLASGALTTYLRDDPVRVLGCGLQYQYCNPNLEPDIRCTPLAGAVQVQELAKSLWQTKKQKALIDWSSTVILTNVAALSTFAEGLGVSSLTSRYSLRNGMQGSLPPNQWQLEMKYWFSIVLAELQRAMVDIASGPIGANLTQWLVRPQTPEAHLLCRSQKIRSDSFTSFSTLGLSILLGIGGLIIAVSYTLEPIVNWIQRRRNISIYKRLEWTTNETLQLQRLAHEEIGFGTWSRTAEDHPITAPGEKLAILDVSEPNHPKLASLVPKSGASSQGEPGNNGTGEIIEQVASAASPNHAAIISGSGSTIVDSTSSANDNQALQTPTTRPIDDPLRHHPTW